MDQKELKILTWFSEQYYNLMDLGNGQMQYNDLRYGTLSFKFDEPKDFIFHFNLTKEGDHLKVLPERERPKRDPEELQKFWERIRETEGRNNLTTKLFSFNQIKLDSLQARKRIYS